MQYHLIILVIKTKIKNYDIMTRYVTISATKMKQDKNIQTFK